jgi:hypothetical protein
MLEMNQVPALDLRPVNAGAVNATGMDDQMQMDGNALCPGCQQSVVDKASGVVVAFG